VEEARAMKGRVSPGTQRPYPLTMICAVYRVPRSSVYAAGAPPSSAAGAQKPGPKTRHSDADVIAAIRAVLAACPFHGEGYRKVRARLAHRGLHLGGKRVLRLMRTHGLLAPRRLGPPNGNPAHDGTIITDRPDVMWGTDATRFWAFPQIAISRCHREDASAPTLINSVLLSVQEIGCGTLPRFDEATCNEAGTLLGARAPRSLGRRE